MRSTAIHGDCEDIMSGMQDNEFDIAIVDPPYFSGPEKRMYYGKRISTTGIERRNYDVTETWQVPNAEYFQHLFRVSRQQIIWGSNYFEFKNVKPFKTPRRNEIDDFLIQHPKGWIVWDKCNGASSFNDFELAWTSFDMPSYIYPFMWNGMMQGLSANQGWIMQGNKKLNQKRIHPTEKPIELYRYIIDKYTTMSDSILDTHLGSGSSRIAAEDLERQFYGIELDKTHFDNQESRFRKILKQKSAAPKLLFA